MKKSFLPRDIFLFMNRCEKETWFMAQWFYIKSFMNLIKTHSKSDIPGRFQ